MNTKLILVSRLEDVWKIFRRAFICNIFYSFLIYTTVFVNRNLSPATVSDILLNLTIDCLVTIFICDFSVLMFFNYCFFVMQHTCSVKILKLWPILYAIEYSFLIVLILLKHPGPQTAC